MGRHLKEKEARGRHTEVKRGVASEALTTLASIAADETKKNGKFVIPVPGKINTSDQNSLHRGLT